MGWKWNDIRAPVAQLGLTDQQTNAVEAIVTAKKWDLVDILEQQVEATERSLLGREVKDARILALREVIAGVKPKGPRP